jgi:hypothetical protein
VLLVKPHQFVLQDGIRFLICQSGFFLLAFRTEKV